MGTVQFFDAAEHQFTNFVEVFDGRETPIPVAELASTDVRVHHRERHRATFLGRKMLR